MEMKLLTASSSSLPHAGIATQMLPQYSDRILSATKSNAIVTELDRMVEETAYHILKNGDMQSRDECDKFGRRLYEIYPSIEFPGNQPWVCM